jgi:hypothetical protein
LFLLEEFRITVSRKKKEKEAANKPIDWRYRQLTGGSSPTPASLQVNYNTIDREVYTEKTL